MLATLAGRRPSRFYALAVAAIVTLFGVDPQIAGDIGWQLSFVAVLGIMLVAKGLRGDDYDPDRQRRVWRRERGGRGRADNGGHDRHRAADRLPLRGALSTTTLAANLLALPAVAPAMWLGMLAAGAGQVPGFPVEALNAIYALLLAYIAQVAAWCGRPGWAYPHVRLGAAG